MPGFQPEQAYGFAVGTGLIVAFVVTVWAAYFVPLALRRYDEAHNSSALEVLTPLSRVIRRAPAAEAAPEVTDIEEIPVEQPAVEVEEPTPAVARERHPRPGHTRAAARLAAKRRLRVLLTLLFANAVVGALLGFQIVPVWAIAIPATLLVAWLVACRIQVRKEYGIVTERAPREARTPRVSVPSMRSMRAQTKARLPKVVRLGSSAAEDEDTVMVVDEEADAGKRHIMENVPLEADALDERLVIAVPSAASHGELVWDPLPVTLPTYVTKPRAGRTVRTIDFNAPGAWTSGHVEGEQTELETTTSDDAASDGQRRAAGQ